MEFISLVIHGCCAFVLFYYLDQRFIKIGIDYFINRDELDDIFHDTADCLAGKHSKWADQWETTRKSCELYMNPFFQKALTFLWFLYAGGAVFHVLYLVVQLLAIITCLEKR